MEEVPVQSEPTANAGPSAARFAANERVFVPHTDRYYEAKILKSEYRGQNGWFYFLHYNGWNKKYDEWVEEGGLVKAEIAEAAGAALPLNAKGKKGPAGGAGFVRGKAGVTALGNTTPQGQLVGLDIDLPPCLKKILIDDYECVFEEARFVPLPRTPCVADILENYVADAKDVRTGSTVDAEEEVAHGLQSYFDKTLLACLLYRNERVQAAHALSDGRQPSAVYGAEHLVRLIHRLSDIMPLATLPDDVQAHLATMVQDVIQYLVENFNTLFLTKDQYLAPAVGVQAAGAQQAHQVLQQAAV